MFSGEDGRDQEELHEPRRRASDDSVRTQRAPEDRNSPRGSDRSRAPGFASAHHAFMNQKIIPMSPSRWLVNGVGRPARKYQSRPRCVRMPGVNVTLVC